MEPVSISMACGLAGALWGIRFGRRSSPLDGDPMSGSAVAAPTGWSTLSSRGTDDGSAPETCGFGGPDDLDVRFAQFLAADPDEQPARRWLLGA